MTPTQAASYLCSYHKIVTSCSEGHLRDVYGFLVSETAPLERGHPYNRFVALEETFKNELRSLRDALGTGIPYVKELLEAELGLGNRINPKFYELIAASREE